MPEGGNTVEKNAPGLAEVKLKVRGLGIRLGICSTFFKILSGPMLCQRWNTVTTSPALKKNASKIIQITAKKNLKTVVPFLVQLAV